MFKKYAIICNTSWSLICNNFIGNHTLIWFILILYLKQHILLQQDPQGGGDDDGWITVSRHTAKKGKPTGNSSVKGQAKIKAKDAKRRHRKELLNFYKFQTREKKLDRLNELKERFESDKLKQAKMKQDRQDRKFRPV